MPAAVGTSLPVIAVNSASALTASFGGGISLDWPLLGVFTLAALAGALAGNRVASRVSASRLTAAFTGLLIAVAVSPPRRSLPALNATGPCPVAVPFAGGAPARRGARRRLAPGPGRGPA